MSRAAVTRQAIDRMPWLAVERRASSAAIARGNWAGDEPWKFDRQKHGARPD